MVRALIVINLQVWGTEECSNLMADTPTVNKKCKIAAPRACRQGHALAMRDPSRLACGKSFANPLCSSGTKKGLFEKTGKDCSLLSLTRKTDYALVALAGLASGRSGSESAHELAERLRLPLPALRNILKQLAHHGIVSSTQGASGGYRLARPARQVTLADVVQAVQGPVRLALCCASEREDGERGHVCRLEDSCKIKATVRTVHHRLMDFLDEVNLEQIASGNVGAKSSPRRCTAVTTIAASHSGH
jgi:Rrf2 family protein